MYLLIALILIPVNAIAANGDDLTVSVGFVILAAGITGYRAKRYFKTMDSKIESALSIKQQVAGLLAAGGLTITATNVISLFGMCLTAAGLVFIYLNFRINKDNKAERQRANDIAAERLAFDKSQATRKPAKKQQGAEKCQH